MALESIQMVTQAETGAKELREAAAVQAKQRLLGAQKEARQIVEQARQQGEAQARQLMAEAEKRAAEMTEAVLDQARQACEAQKACARQNLEQAAQLIVEKVVDR